MYDLSLTERLEQAGRSAPVGAGPATAVALADSVIANIRRIFNSRQGSCETRPDYGMPDLNDVATLHVEVVPRILRVVAEQIRLFEPRLTNVEVTHLLSTDDRSSLSFSVSALLKVGDDAEPIRFATTVSDDRRIHVER